MTNDTTFPLDELRALQKQIGDANAEKGFHEEGASIQRLPQLLSGIHHALLMPVVNTMAKLFPSIERNYWSSRLALLTTEVAEAIEELRNGRQVDEVWYSAQTPLGLTTWYPDERPEWVGDDILGKPEGVPSEIADVVIRAFDLADEAGIDLAAVIQEKLAYNATRAQMHGRTF